MGEEGSVISPEEQAAKRARARALQASIRDLRVEPDELVVSFHAGVDERLVRDLIALERHYSPELEIEYVPSARVLRVHVLDPEHRPTLAALAAALS